MPNGCHGDTNPSVCPGNLHRVEETEFDFCPHFAKPFPECFCRQFDSLTIPKIVAYCNGAYALCPIFRRASDEAAPTKNASK
ncbi:MAG: hypothetical protein KA419_00435 [Acidobacteria bacterium]|nr:hypothetical protein [Acidobacteriota bacterium]